MKRILLFISILLLSLYSLFAYTDVFKSMSEDPLYLAFIGAVKNSASESELLKAFNTYIESDITPVERARAEYHLVRFYKDNGEDEKARAHMSAMQALYDALPAETDDFQKTVVLSELKSLEYYMTKKIGDGLESSNIQKRLYKDYPNDVFSVMNEVWRLIYTPPIAGGNYRKAIKLVDELFKTQGNELSNLDRYSMTVAKAMALNRRDEYEEANELYEEAFKYYPAEPMVTEEYKKNLKKLK